MGKHHLLEIILLLAFLLQYSVNPSSAACSNNTLIAGFKTCADLQPASTLAWTFFGDNNTLSIAYSDTALSESGWVGWGINFDGTGMVGANTLVAFKGSNGVSTVLLYKLTADVKSRSAPLNPVSSFDQLQVLNMSTQISGTTFTIFATLQLSAGQTKLNHVYNRGPSVSNNVPAYHSTSPRDGMQTIDMTTGSITAAEPSASASEPSASSSEPSASASKPSPSGAPNLKLKNVYYGILAAVSWGVFLIMGAMSAPNSFS